jgi:dTDP-4-dehydrorhamnose reductase
MDLTDAAGIKALFAAEHFDVVINLAAQVIPSPLPKR